MPLSHHRFNSHASWYKFNSLVTSPGIANIFSSQNFDLTQPQIPCPWKLTTVFSEKQAIPWNSLTLSQNFTSTIFICTPPTNPRRYRPIQTVLMSHTFAHLYLIANAILISAHPVISTPSCFDRIPLPHFQRSDRCQILPQSSFFLTEILSNSHSPLPLLERREQPTYFRLRFLLNRGINRLVGVFLIVSHAKHLLFSTLKLSSCKRFLLLLKNFQQLQHSPYDDMSFTSIVSQKLEDSSYFGLMRVYWHHSLTSNKRFFLWVSDIIPFRSVSQLSNCLSTNSCTNFIFMMRRNTAQENQNGGHSKKS